MILMKKNWKLCETLVVGIIGTNEIHLADPTQKSYVKEIDKLLNKEGGKKIIIENNNFSIRLCGVNILVSHPELPCECSLQNQSDLEDIVRIIPYTKIDNGVFDGNNWSFLMDSQKNFLPAKEGIKIYEDAEIKMIRNFSLGSVTKTSKWVPGYYYFNEDTVYYYLGTMCTWKIQNSIANTTYGPQKTDETLHMVLDASDFRPVKGQTYNITDIIKDNFHKIKFLKKRSNMAKSQVAFAKDDFTNYLPLVEGLLEKWIKNNRINYNDYSSLITFSTGVENFFKIIEYSTSGEDLNLSTRSIELIESVIRDKMKFELIRRFNPKKHNISSLQEVAKQVFFNSISGDIYNQEDYYGNMLLSFGINIDNISKEIVDNFNPLLLMDTWEHYTNNIVNVLENPGELTEFFFDDSCEKNKNYSYYYGGKSNFSDKEKPVFEGIMDFCRETSKDHNEYMVRNAGTLSKPKYVEVFTITLDTIYRMYGNNVPSEVQDVLISGRFKKVTIKKDLK